MLGMGSHRRAWARGPFCFQAAGHPTPTATVTLSIPRGLHTYLGRLVSLGVGMTATRFSRAPGSQSQESVHQDCENEL